jgi:glycosyltransferase involved in cell wall biosynthesis
MNILYFTPFYPPQNEAAAPRSFAFINTLEQSGHTVKVITNSKMLIKLAGNKEKSIIRLAKENFVGLELFLRILISKPDRVILSSPPFFTICWGALASFMKNIPYILDIRDLYPDVFFEMGLIKEHSFLGKLARKFTIYLYSKSKMILTVTNGLQNEIGKYLSDPQKVILARNGYDQTLFYPCKLEEKFEKFSIIFHGTLGKAQNINTLIAVAKKLKHIPELEILVAGDGPKLRELLDKKATNIKYLGNLPSNEIPKLIRKCHLGLSFRKDDKIGREAFPVKVFEYIGSGIPSIITPKGEAGEMLLKDGLGFQFSNEEIHLISAKIIDLMNEKKIIFPNESYTRQSQSVRILDAIK